MMKSILLIIIAQSLLLFLGDVQFVLFSLAYGFKIIYKNVNPFGFVIV